MKGAHFVEDTTETPDVAFVVVLLLAANLRRQVLWRADSRRREVVLVAQGPRDAKVAQLEQSAASQENVLRLEVPVQNVVPVKVLNG